MFTLDKLYERNIGNIRLVVKSTYDESPDHSFIGEFSNYRFPQNKDEKLVHRASQSVLSDDGVWRNELGQIQAVPETNSYNRDYEYTFHNNGHEKIKYALQDHKRLEALARGDWSYLGITADVSLDGAQVGSGSLYGIESDGGDSYITEIVREVSSEALAEAKEWKARNLIAS